MQAFADGLKVKYGITSARFIARYSLSVIEKETGFIDLLPNLLKKEGLTMDDYLYMSQKSVNKLTDIEKTQISNIRNAIPKATRNDLCQKVIPQGDIANYLKTDNPYTAIRGFITRAADAKHLKTYDDLYYGERLDFLNAQGKQNFYIEDGSCGVIIFKSSDVEKAIIPSVDLLPTNNYPFTGFGITAGKNGRMGAPELMFKEGDKAIPTEGDELWEVFSNGDRKLRGKYSKEKERFIPIK